MSDEDHVFIGGSKTQRTPLRNIRQQRANNVAQHQEDENITQSQNADKQQNVCMLCGSEDVPNTLVVGTDDIVDWVQCDTCLNWYHCACLKIPLPTSDEHFDCFKCKENPPQKQGEHQKTRSRSSKGSHVSSAARLQILSVEMKQLEREKELQKQLLEAQFELEQAALEKRKQMLQKIHQNELVLARKKFELEKQTALQEIEENDDDHHSEISSISKVNAWRKENFCDDRQNADVIDKSQYKVVNINTVEPPVNLLSQKRLYTEPELGSKFMKPILTQQHVLARKAINTKLPIFDGKPENWSIFINAYTTTTESCRFSDLENLDRLRNCLKDKAFRAVEDMLTSPDNLSQIIQILRMHFGNPKMIILALVTKVRNFPKIKLEDYEQLIEFSFVVRNLCNKIKSSGMTCHLSDPCLIEDLVVKLDPFTKVKWFEFKSKHYEETLPMFCDWICQYAANFIGQTSVRTNAAIKPAARQSGVHKTRATINTHSVDSKNSSDSNEAVPSQKCIMCKNDCKSLPDCQQFRQCNVKERFKVVCKNKICRRCLLAGHWFLRCKKICGKNGCTLRHHELLHDEQWNQKEKSPNNVQQTLSTSETISTNGKLNTHRQNSTMTYQIVPVKIYSNGKSTSTFAFLDTGSSLTLIEEKLADELNLDGAVKPLTLTWSDSSQRNETESRQVSFQISGTAKKSRKFMLSKIHTVQQLVLPKQTVCHKDIVDEFPYLSKIPIESFEEGRPRILIGLDNTHLLSVIRCVEGKPGQMVAALTRLGWVLYGPNSQPDESHVAFHNVHVFAQPLSDSLLHQFVQKQFTIDSLGICAPNQILSKDEDRAIKLMEETTVRIGDRFETGLLWRYDHVEMPNSLPTAQRRFQQLQQKMAKDPQLAVKLQQMIKDYVFKRYARKLTKEELAEEFPNTWYLPVFPIININKPGKLRLVWDAASSVNGISLNSLLLSGPDQLSSLISVLYCFRQRNIALNADIKEMFHQIRIKSSDQHAQRFLWKDENSSTIDVYVLEVMTFGSTCSPSCAQYVKNKNALEFAQQYPNAARCIVKNHYVDDLLDSVNTEEEAVKLAKEVILVHGHAGFEIRNWKSSSSNVMKKLGEENNIALLQNLDFDQDSSIEKVLGMWWCMKTDTFQYKIRRNENNMDFLTGISVPTKRMLLKIVMSLYDPLGLLAHYIIFAKIILQSVWRSQLDWDDTLNSDQYEKWLQWTSLLPVIEMLRIPRTYLHDLQFDEADSVQLHMFADASEDAYCAVGYFRVEIGDKVEVNLVSAKSRVAPIKQLSIPRLELEAALIASRLARDIMTKHSIKISSVILWSDSKVVLSWIRSDHRKYRTYVAHRVSEILDHTEIKNWRFVPSRENVADDGTKWASTQNFTSNHRWFTGPPFLKLNPNNWPEDVTLRDCTTEELRHQNLHVANSRNHLKMKMFDPTRFSKWRRMLRTICYVIRFLRNVSNKEVDRVSGPILLEEYCCAEIYIFQQAQSEEYVDEISRLKQSSTNVLPKSSPIYRDFPYIDDDGLLRARGRIDRAIGVPDELKRPILLPGKSRITELLIMSYHDKYHHLNSEIVVNEIRQRFVIPKLRQVLRKLINKCNRCKIRTAKPSPPLMGDLPEARLSTFSRPFTSIGIDYFGPIMVKVGRRIEKRWGMLVTCLTTRAIHVEVANSLSADSCIMCLRNFIARRGTPRQIISDNGTNFRGASVELAEAVERIDRDRLISEMTSSTVAWHFIPPSSPHMGGSWERMVRSVKTILHEVLRTKTPSDELFRSALLEVESIINSRPLTYVPLKSDIDESITPNHFLVGTSNGMKPLLSNNDTKPETLRKNWMTSQKIANEFWRKWIREYLPELTRRSKWYQPAKPVKVGDLVIIIDDNNPRNCWPRGRVVEAVPDSQGQTRKVIVQTSTGFYERPVVKLAVLELEGNSDSISREVPGGSVAEAGEIGQLGEN